MPAQRCTSTNTLYLSFDLDERAVNPEANLSCVHEHLWVYCTMALRDLSVTAKIP